MKIIEKSIGLKFERLFALRTAEVYYSETSDLTMSGFDVLQFTQCKCQFNDNGRKFLTRIINLELENAEIFTSFKYETQYEIRRCERADALVISINSNPDDRDLDNFMHFYREFHEQKNYAGTAANCNFYREMLRLFKSHDALVITSIATKDQKPLCAHTYLVDGNRARLINSASVFRAVEANVRSLVGRGNRYLHWRDMLFFKQMGYRLYDLGGVSENPDDTVSRFKRSFGGVEVLEFFDFYRPFTLKGRLALWLEAAAKKGLRWSISEQ